MVYEPFFLMSSVPARISLSLSVSLFVSAVSRVLLEPGTNKTLHTIIAHNSLVTVIRWLHRKCVERNEKNYQSY